MLGEKSLPYAVSLFQSVSKTQGFSKTKSFLGVQGAIFQKSPLAA